MAAITTTNKYQQAVQCKNCFKHFVPAMNQENACLYHPGNTVELRAYRAGDNYPGQEILETPEAVQNFPKAFRWDCCYDDYINGKPRSGCRKGNHVAATLSGVVDSTTRIKARTLELPNMRKTVSTTAAMPAVKKSRISKNPTAVRVVKIAPSGEAMHISAEPQMVSAPIPTKMPQMKAAKIVKPAYKADPGVVKVERRRADFLNALVANRPRLCNICKVFRSGSEIRKTSDGKLFEPTTTCLDCSGDAGRSDVSTGEVDGEHDGAGTIV